jgi:hypothetical protein
LAPTAVARTVTCVMVSEIATVLAGPEYSQYADVTRRSVASGIGIDLVERPISARAG